MEKMVDKKVILFISQENFNNCSYKNLILFRGVGHGPPEP